MQVEMLFALDDGSWFSEILSIPDAAVNADFASGQWDAEVIDWVTTHACPPDCVLVAVYNSDQQEERRTADVYRLKWTSASRNISRRFLKKKRRC
jgi:hypothetical protein